MHNLKVVLKCAFLIFSSFLDPWLNFLDGQIPHFADDIWWWFFWWTGFMIRLFLDQRFIGLKNKSINQ